MCLYIFNSYLQFDDKPTHDSDPMYFKPTTLTAVNFILNWKFDFVISFVSRIHFITIRL